MEKEIRNGQREKQAGVVHAGVQVGSSEVGNGRSGQVGNGQGTGYTDTDIGQLAAACSPRQVDRGWCQAGQCGADGIGTAEG